MSSTGGEIEQGVLKKDQFIRVLRKRLTDLSDGEYTIHGKVRKFGPVTKKGIHIEQIHQIESLL